MKKLFFPVIAGILSSSLMASPVDKKNIENLPLLKKAKIKVEKILDQGDIYQLDLGKGQTAFLTHDKKTIIFGRAFNTNTTKELKIPVDMSKVDLKKQAFEFGSGKNEYIVFTDPECPYCKKFEKQWSALKDKVKFHVFLFPLSFHQNATKMSLYILSQKTDALRAKALSDISDGKKDFLNADKFSKEKIKKLYALLKKGQNVADALGVRGTPSMFTLKGERVNWSSLMSKYKITPEKINPRVFHELMKKSNYITYGTGNDTLYVFTDINISSSAMKKLDKLAKSHKMIIFLKPTNGSQLKMFETVYVLNKKTNKERLASFKEFVAGRTLSKDELDKVKQSIGKNKNKSNLSPLQSLMVIGFANEQLHLPQKTVFINVDGVIQKF
ncbi:DsbC family protein [Sulfurimonas indica]|uniref:DsbC family protein n=1 Tax=Sulfurimonas TaxID=202746 RepID=UPI0012655D04|nr:DsbC family protein [Sulfurimonas indica]